MVQLKGEEAAGLSRCGAPYQLAIMPADMLPGDFPLPSWFMFQPIS